MHRLSYMNARERNRNGDLARHPTSNAKPRTERTTLAFAMLAALAQFSVPSFASADDSASSSPTFGSDEYWLTVMDQATYSAMRQQEKLQPLVQELSALVDKYPSAGFTSLAFEGDALAVYWKGPRPAAIEQVVKAAQVNLPVHFREARYSMKDMETFAAKLSRFATGSDIQSISLSYDGSGVQVTKKPTSEVAKAKAKSGRSLRAVEDILTQVRSQVSTGDVITGSIPVAVTTAEQPVELMGCAGTCNRLDDSAAWNGGTRIINRDSPLGPVSCTSGFGVKQGSNYYLVTAAHCAHSTGDRYYDAAGEYIGMSCGENSTLDIQIICAAGFYRMFDGLPTTSNYKVVRGWGNHVVNELLCQSGATSGTVCGLKTIGGDYSVFGQDSDGDQFYLRGLIKTVQVDGRTGARPGDSGGPVFSLLGDGVRAKGTVSAAGGTEMYFQDWADYLRQWPNMYPRTP